jgi:hypothetical protein
VLGLTGVAAFKCLMYTGLHSYDGDQRAAAAGGDSAGGARRRPDAVRYAGERCQLLGIAASMLGVAVIVFQGQPSHVLGFRFGLGDALVLIAVVDWALYTVLLRKRPTGLAAELPAGDVPRRA